MPLALLLGGCEYDLDVAAAWQIDHPRVIGFRMEMVEPAPIWLERLAGAVGDSPIAEALPGDRVRLLPLVVDGQGRAQPPESIDAIWFQCGLDNCVVDVGCDSIEWTTDVACELGRGGGFEFTIPTLGPTVFEERAMKVLGIIGRDPSVDAERCRAGLLAGTSELSACTLVEGRVLLGPRWVLQHVAVETGLEPEVSVDEIPYLALLQPANRPPAPGVPVWIDADTNGPIEGSPPRIRPGQRVVTSGPSWLATDRQVYASLTVSYASEGFLFVGNLESRGALYLASGPIWFTEVEGSALEFVVDANASPGPVRVVIVVGDQRHGDGWGTLDMLVAELEVVP